MFPREKAKDCYVYYTIRKGLEVKYREDFPLDDQRIYKKLLIAAFIFEKEAHFDFETGFGQQCTIAINMLKNYKQDGETKNTTEEEAAAIIKNQNAYPGIEKKYIEDALAYTNNPLEYIKRLEKNRT